MPEQLLERSVSGISKKWRTIDDFVLGAAADDPKRRPTAEECATIMRQWQKICPGITRDFSAATLTECPSL